MKNIAPKLFIFFGILCLLFTVYLYHQRTDPQRIQFTHTQVKQVQAVQANKHRSKPIALNIPSQNINLPVLTAAITNGEWETTTKGVSYLADSPIPGEKGNSIIYGHNWGNLLGRLVGVKPGDTIEISYADGSKKTFEIEYTVTVTPDQTHILAASQDNRITIYTCTGFLDSKRFVAVGILKV